MRDRPSTTTRPDHRALVLFVMLALAAGLAARLWHVATDPLWLDEAYTAYAADRSLAFLWRVVPSYETHPPFFYTLMHTWHGVVGDALWTRRLPSVLCGIATCGVTALAARRLAPGAWMPAVALALAATNTMLGELARQARPYALMDLVYGIAVVALLRPGRPATAAVLLCEALLAWLHNLGALHAAALALALLIATPPRCPRDWLRFGGGQALVALAWVPALLILLDQAPAWIASTWLRFEWRLVPTALARLYATEETWPLLLVLALAGAWLLPRRRAAMLVLLATLPSLVALLVSAAVTPVFLGRTLSPCVVPALLLTARGSLLPGRWRWLGLALSIGLAGGNVTRSAMLRAHGPAQPWHVAVEWLARRYRPGDALWAYPNEGALPFDLAARDRRLPLRARPIPMAVPARGIGFYPTGSRGAVSLRPAEIARFTADGQARTAPTLWLIRLGPNAYDRGDAMLKALERDGRRPVSAFRGGPISIVGLRRTTLGLPDYLRGVSDRAAPAAAAAAR